MYALIVRVVKARHMMLTHSDMAHFLTDVRQSMLSSRRTLAIPQDFLQALHTHQLSLRSLLSHLDPPILPSRSQFALSTEVVEEEETYALPFLGPVLNGAPDERAKLYVPKHFPAFPSKHTYKATPDFPDRERDPRKIRERATEEGRMGEEALRRLVGAASENGPIPEPESSPKGWSMHRRRDHLWRETMQILIPRSENAPEGLEKEKQREGNVGEPLKGSSRVSSAVNADRRFWRKAIAPRALQRNPDHEGL